MNEPTLAELQQSIQELSTYRDRLAQEVTLIAQKLQMPEKKINSSLKGNSELIKIESLLKKLIQQRDKRRYQD